MNPAVLKERLDTIGVLARPDNADTVDDLIKSLASIKNMRQIIINLRKGISGGNGNSGGVARSIWANIRLFVYHALKITDAIHEVVGADRLCIRKKIFENFDGRRLAEVGTDINGIIDFELSQQSRRTVVNAGVNEALDELKKTYDGLESLLGRVAEVVKEELPVVATTEANAVFIPQIGFLISIDIDAAEDETLWSGSQADTWEKMFVTEEKAYYKTPQVAEMDDYYGDIYGRICGEWFEQPACRFEISSCMFTRSLN